MDNDNHSKPLPDPQPKPYPSAASQSQDVAAESAAAKPQRNSVPASKNSRARFRRPRKPNRRMLAWFRFYTDPASPTFDNKRGSSRMAGYPGRKGSSAWGVQGQRNANHPVLQEMIRQALDDAGATIEHGARRVREAMDATQRKVFRTSTDELIYSDPEPDHAMRLRASMVMFDLQREGKQCAKHGAAEPAETLDGAEFLAVDGDPQQIACLENRAEQMPDSDRMLARHEMGLYRRILKLKEKQAD